MVHVGPDHQIATIDERGKHGLCDRRNDPETTVARTDVSVALGEDRTGVLETERLARSGGGLDRAGNGSHIEFNPNNIWRATCTVPKTPIR